jgi:hypothetical protein
VWRVVVGILWQLRLTGCLPAFILGLALGLAELPILLALHLGSVALFRCRHGCFLL